MERPKTKRFSGDSFGNLDLSNAEPDMETEIAIPTGTEGEKPSYECRKDIENSAVLSSNPTVDKEVKPLNTISESNLGPNSRSIGEDEHHGNPHSTELVENVEVSEKVDVDMVENKLAYENTNGNGQQLEGDLEEVTISNDSLIAPEATVDEDHKENGFADGDNKEKGDGEEDGTDDDQGLTSAVNVENQINNSDNLDNTNHDEAVTNGIHSSNPCMVSESWMDDAQRDEADAEENNDDIAEVDDEISNDNGDDESEYLLLESPTRPHTRSTLREVPGGMRAKANTPASQYTTTLENLDSPNTPQVQLDSERVASRGSRDEVFQRAMTLMSNRCTSARGEEGELFSAREPPFGIHIPQYFYVQQSKPAPMSPLKVWRGYKGNVYFEPINVCRIKSANTADAYGTQLDRVASEQARISLASTPAAGARRGNSAWNSTSRTGGGIPPLSRGETPATRATTAASGNAPKSYRYIEQPPSAAPQVFVMDKQAVISSLRNSGGAGGASRDIQRDLHFIEGMESTGSLAVRPLSGGALVGAVGCSVGGGGRRGGGGLRGGGSGGGPRILPKLDRPEKKLLFKRDRLCKGPNFSAVERQRKENSAPDAAPVAANSRKTSTRSSVLTSPRSSSRISAYRPGSRSAGPSVRPQRFASSFPGNDPNLVVSGDKFAPPTVMSPLLRPSGQFPLSGAGGGGGGGDGMEEDPLGESGLRAAVNSPDLVDARGMMMTMAISPPLDPLRISLRHATSPHFDPHHHAVGGNKGRLAGRGKREGTRPLTCSEELKPFIKYSHDVKVHYERNNVNYC